LACNVITSTDLSSFYQLGKEEEKEKEEEEEEGLRSVCCNQNTIRN